MAKSELTEMQEKFCREYAESGNATASAINAGYSKSTASVQGSRLLKHVKIQKRVAELREELGIKVPTRKEEMVEELYNIMSDKDTQAQHKLKAIELIAKIEGYYKDSPEIKVDNTVNTFDPSKMSDEELIKKMQEVEKEIGDELH